MVGQVPLPEKTLLYRGAYQIEIHLGTGGFGITYRALELKLNRVVAIKEFFPYGCIRRGKKLVADGDWDEEFLSDHKNAFLEECRILSTLKHPGIVGVRRFFMENETVYLVMEFIEGESLTHYLKTHQGAPPVEETLTLIRQAGEALMVVHEAGLLHRDLKPANIMRRTDGQAVLIDFGAAREMERTHTLIGTPGYMPLEQLEEQSKCPPGPYSDIYALSATLYKLLTGVTPTDARSRILMGLQSPRALRPDIPEAVSESILHGLSLKAEERPQTIKAFLEALFPSRSSVSVKEPQEVIKKEAPFLWPTPDSSDIFDLSLDDDQSYDDAISDVIVLDENTDEDISLESPYLLSLSDDGLLDTEVPSIKINPIDGAEMILIPAGEFLMGDENTGDNPPRMVTLDSYYIYRTPVTVGQYHKFCKATNRQMPEEPFVEGWFGMLRSFNKGWTKTNHPIVKVSWEDAKAYCDWARVSLPTEAQWEKAARGTDGRKYPWGETWEGSWCWCSHREYGDAKGTAAVGSYPQGMSPYGVLDMAGNVKEWCWDWYDRDYYKTAPIINPSGPQFSPQVARVLRGGSWYSRDAEHFTCYYREKAQPNASYQSLSYKAGYFVGFRCALDANSGSPLLF